jgi:tripartite ATP-independent transporter DctP family solute receptor
MKKRNLLAASMAALMAFGLTACSGSSTATTTAAATQAAATTGSSTDSASASNDDIAPLELMAGCTYNTTSASFRYCNEFSDRLAEISGGKLTVNWNPASTLGNTTQHYAMLKEGTLDMFSTAFDTTSTLQDAQDFNALVVPYIFDDQAHLEKFIASDVFKNMVDKVETANNIKFVGNICTNWPRGLSTTNKPIKVPDDLKGMKLRVPESPSVTAVWAAWGANPTSVSVSELYASLENGIVDGQDNNVISLYNNSYYEVQKYYMELNYIQQANVLWMSQNTWNKLNDTQKEWINEAVAEAYKVNTDSVYEEHDQCVEAVKAAGIEFVDFDKDAFKVKAEEVARQLEGQQFREGLYDEIRALAD